MCQKKLLNPFRQQELIKQVIRIDFHVVQLYIYMYSDLVEYPQLLVDKNIFLIKFMEGYIIIWGNLDWRAFIKQILPPFS